MMLGARSACGELIGRVRIVALAESRKVGLEKLTLAELREIDARIEADVFDVLSVNASVKSRSSFGGTAPNEVRKQVRYWKKRLKQDARRAKLR